MLLSSLPSKLDTHWTLLLMPFQNTIRNEIYRLPAPSFILKEALGVDFDHPFNWAELQGDLLLFVQLFIQ